MLENTSVVIVTYNHKEYIEKCLDSIPSGLEVIVVDNISTDGTPELIEKKYGNVKLIRNNINAGYGKGVNIGVQNSNKEYLVILNPDTIIEDNSIEKLINPLITNKNVVTVPKAVLYDGSAINTCGNIEHFTGLTFTRGLGENINCFNEFEKLSGLSGLCFALKKDIYYEIGGFDENIFLYMEDAELSWNINSKNLEILYVPDSVIYHCYEFNLPAEKIYFVEKGRYIILRKYFNWKHYLLFLPSLILTELLTFGYSILNGSDWIKFKLKGIRDGFRAPIERVDCDRKQLFNALDSKLPENENLMNNNIKKIANLIYIINYALIMGLWNLNIPKIKPLINTEIIGEKDDLD